MPWIRESSDSSPVGTEKSDLNASFGQQIVDDETYAATTSGYTENPLSEQLEPIAVCGMGCRLPGDVKSASEFWDLMMSKRSGQTPKVPESRFKIDAHIHPDNDRPGSFNVLGGYFLNETLQEFDPSFFGITPIEAMWMDPQQRKLLEVVYECFESAGVSLDDVAGSKTAVFAASFTSDFQQMCFKEPAFRHSLAATGVDPGIISNRISHAFNLKGPSIVVNTACSSSVYAVHNACNSLRNKECAAAVVCGVNLVLTVDQHMNTAKLGVLSPTSTCHTFDASADGYGRAEGVGSVYLKRLSDAVRDGDPIRGVIRSSATNNNGKVPAVGITHPNRDGQVEVITHAYDRGGNLDPRLTGYFECHGTGTSVGDPLEVNAVALAMNQQRSTDGPPLMVGAVKTNIGHSEAASGLSALIKGILAVEKGIIPPTKGVENPSPAIKWEDWKVTVPTSPSPFPHVPINRISINSFGYGGTNAHIIVESADSLLTQKQTYKLLAPASQTPKMPRGAFQRNRPFLVTFSAHDKAALQRNFDAHVAVTGRCEPLDLTYTLANHRTAFSSRGFTAVSHENMKKGQLGTLTVAENKKTPALGFVFTGQGAQWARMGAELMTYYPSFLRSIRTLDRALGDLQTAPDWTIEDTLLAPVETSLVGEAEYAQPLTTAIQIALVQLLRTWGVEPAVTVGHSSGEIAAAYAAGHVSASEAIVLAYYRGFVVKDIKTEGAMMAVGLGAEDVKPYVDRTNGKVIIACHNSPSGVTLSGDAPVIAQLEKELNADKIFARQVKTSGKAYHSHHMAPASARYEELVSSAKDSMLPFDMPLDTDAKMVSSVTNSVIDQNAALDEVYFSKNLRQPVLFNQAVETILTKTEFANEDLLLIEIGPHSAMKGPITQIKTAVGASKLEYLSTLLRGEDSAMQMLKLVGELYLRNCPVDIDRVTSIEESLDTGKVICKRGNLIADLPPYQWSKKSYWAEARGSDEHRHPKYPRHDLLGSLVPGASLSEPTWRNFFRIRDVPWLADHALGGEAVFPAAGYFSMAMEAITQITELSEEPKEITNYVLRDVSIKKALITPDDDTGVEVIFNMRPTTYNDGGSVDAWWDFNVSSINQDGILNDHMIGTIAVNARPHRPAAKKFNYNLNQRASGKEWNQALRGVGFDYGPTFADMTDIEFNGKDYICKSKTAIKTEAGNMVSESRHVLHPATVDSTLQLMIASISAGRTKAMAAAVAPVQVDEVSIWVPTDAQLGEGNATAWVDERGIRSFVCGNQLLAKDGQVLMEMNNMRATLYEAAVPQSAQSDVEPMPYGEMVWKVDADSVANFQGIESFIELALFKNPAVSVLDIGGEYRESLLSAFPALKYTAAVAQAPDSAIDVSVNKNAKSVEVDFEQVLSEQALEAGSFDIVIASASMPKAIGFQDLLSKYGQSLIMDGNNSGNILNNQAASKVTEGGKPQLQLVYREVAPEVLEKVKSALATLGYAILPVHILDVRTASPNVIMLDFQEPILFNLSEDEFKAVHVITSEAKTLFWASAGGLLNGKNPEAGLTAGLMRAIRAEQASINIVTMDFDLDNTGISKAAKLLALKSAQQIEDAAYVEPEYNVSAGELYISRLVPNEAVNKVASINQDSAVEVPFDEQLRFNGKVHSGKVIFEEGEANADLAPDSVEVRVSTAGLSKESILVINGSDINTTFSHEIGGVVERVGSSVSKVAVGDLVVGFGFGGFGSHQVTSEKMLQKVKKGESLEEMTGLPLAFVSALYGLKHLAGVKSGDVVLVLGGTGLAGAAAIEVSISSGATPYVVTSTEEETDFITKKYSLSREQVLATQEEFSSFVRTASRHSNVNIVFSSGWTPESMSREAWRSIAPFGVFIDSGRKRVMKRGALDPVPFNRGANYCSFDALDLYKLKPTVMADLLAETISLYRGGKISAIEPLNIVNVAELDSAVANFNDSYGAGKTMVTYKESTTPMRIVPAAATTELKSDATYLLVGCLGGLGRSLTLWMMKRGARNFCFLSRSGADAPQASLLVKDLEAAGANVMIVRGDAAVKKDVERAVSSVPSNIPIRGVIQAAMVLRDGIFENMSFQDWQQSTKPKVHGTANLQSVLSKADLDFFLMTSSVSGVLGTPGQANYAAGNAFLDALAHHRRSLGQNACAAIVPMVLGVGVVAENVEIEEALKRKGMYGIDEDYLLRSLELAITEQQSSDLDHLVIGLEPALLARAVKDAGDVDSFWMEDKRFDTLLHHMRAVTGGSGDAGASMLASVLEAASPAEAAQVARDHVVGKLSRMLLLDLEVFEGDTGSVASYGIDSMIGADLRNWIFKEFAMDIPFQQLLAPTLNVMKLGQKICASHGIGSEE